MSKLSRSRLAGPLAPYGPGFQQELAGLGYTDLSAASQVQLMAHLSCWLGERGWSAGDLTVETVQGFLRDRAACGYLKGCSPRGIASLLGYLRGLGVTAHPVAPAPTAVSRLLEEFVGYLTHERGLAALTTDQYARVAAVFLSGRPATAPADDELQLGDLSAGELNVFVLAQSQLRGAGSLNNFVTALRALVRFLHVRGYTPEPLVDALLAGPGWRGGPLSRAVSVDLVTRLLAGCDRATATGQRDHAILVLLVRLGLRRGEVAALMLDDVNWRAGEVMVPGKGGLRERLPLPVDVGRALAEYCRRGRPRRSNRELFIAERAPYGALSPNAVTAIVYRACERSGVTRVSPHQLRHTAATGMRRAGAPLSEIGQVLRHRLEETTAIYTGGEGEALRPLARPWPGGAA